MAIKENTLHKVGRIDQVVRDYFTANPSLKEVAAKDLMQLFISKGIFNKDYSRPGLPIRNLLRQLDAENKLSFLRHCRVLRHAMKRSWYFSRA